MVENILIAIFCVIAVVGGVFAWKYDHCEEKKETESVKKVK